MAPPIKYPKDKAPKAPVPPKPKRGGSTKHDFSGRRTRKGAAGSVC